MALYGERGFDNTTVAEIAERAGLTERTFFRHFRVADAPGSLAPIEAVAEALDAAGAQFQEHREFSRQRQAIIGASAELRERELIKLASLSAALADTLRRRGVSEPDASLTAEAGIAVFRIAFERWVDDANELALPDLMRDSLDHLRSVTGGV